MIGLIFRFLCGVVVGVPIAIIAYYSLPLVAADITLTHIALIGCTAGAISAICPNLLLKGIACGMMWNKI